MRQSKIINLIAFWMIAAIIPGFYQDIRVGLDLILQPRATVNWTFYLCSLILAIGLILRKEWARKGSLWLFGAYTLWGIFVAYSFMGPSFNSVAELLSEIYPVEIDIMKYILAALLVINIVWPIIVISFLTYPSVKILFDTDKIKKLKGRD